MMVLVVTQWFNKWCGVVWCDFLNFVLVGTIEGVNFEWFLCELV